MNTLTLNVREMRNYSKESVRMIKENWELLMLLSLFVCGLLCGCLTLKNDTYFVKTLSKKLVEMLTDSQWIVRFRPCILEVLLTLLLTFFAGLSAVGLPFILCFPCAKGVLYGILSAQLYADYRVKGVIFAALVLFPFLAAETAMLFVGSRGALKMSSRLLSAYKGNGGIGERGEVKTYCVRFFVLSLTSAVVVLLQSLLSGAIGSALLS